MRFQHRVGCRIGKGGRSGRFRSRLNGMRAAGTRDASQWVMKTPNMVSFGAALILVAGACANSQGATVGTATPTSAMVVSLMGSGEACTSNEDCESGFCERAVGNCQGRGACTRVPSCTSTGSDNDERVCGCNGETYFHSCDARMSRMSVSSPGPCGIHP
jgi:hypothetical protein